ncbi:soluble IL-18-binding protein [Yokapox virus]|uniref:Soluble IL-18-binding protein n=1 Tax=Yokapox virus TaxID=1076255 RepID=G3EI84_9POXV|nr:soluble IL-18-binding protein [Yokapox virus]AEN03595.1 soluble IL-18-binding protein [Yokapox virus]
MKIVVIILATFGCLYSFVNSNEQECNDLEIITSTEGFHCSGCVKYIPEFSYMYWLGNDYSTNNKNKFIEDLGDGGIREDETVNKEKNNITYMSKMLRISNIEKFQHYNFTCVLVTLDGVTKKSIWFK